MGEQVEQSTARTRLYQALAEVLSEPPDWLIAPGYQWSLFTAAVDVAHEEDQTAIRQVVIEMEAIPPEGLGKRRAHYNALFLGSNRPHLWLYESLARDGQLAGPSAMAVWSAYESAGLAVAGTELPDHVSVELAFLAYLAGQEAEFPAEAVQWRRARHLFIKHHAGRWLPALGQALADTGDPVYAPIGHLLTAALATEFHPHRCASLQSTRGLPMLSQPENCNLCSFCVQVCPTHALAIHETDDLTALLLSDSMCIACERCVRICSTGALQLEMGPAQAGQRVLCQSPRAKCAACGQPLVSEAELKEVAARIGAPAWLNYCPDCRSGWVENVP
jgi:TorA maturation chaperone TorD/ferredoxin-like protein FixX